ncbi:hypothetical protein GCM10009784_29200 [Arthrobacter parietis]|uniref:Uncharacterized protein n=1 Tax=Arthrobacter parietis TaxID=271434 RepID=A0ABP5MRF9_9MICC
MRRFRGGRPAVPIPYSLRAQLSNHGQPEVERLLAVAGERDIQHTARPAGMLSSLLLAAL